MGVRDSRNGTSVVMRRAVADDALDVLAWRNDPLSRAMSRAREPIDAAGHADWFAQAIADPRRTVLIGELGGRKIGMVRFDHGEETEVSITVNPAFRGRGLGLPLLSGGLAFAPPGAVVAEIRDENLASLRLFERAGFRLEGASGALRRYVRPAG